MGFPGNLVFHIVQAVQIRINNFAALDTDNMGMWIGFFTVVPVGTVWKTKFKNFTQGFDQTDVSVDRCKAHGWKIRFKLPVYGFRTGMIYTFCQNFYYGDPLGCYLMPILF